ncbi:MAG TPA: response regulator [Candidatus Polarisedimenticolia bacterium]|nr:response regulator [Candidatus Polarisedimenticolia bacterium]
MKTILLADDSITIQKVVELTFSEADYRVICVSSGGQALKKMAEVRPDVILLDVIMPEKNGYEVCEQLKRNPSTAGIPVLLLTGTFEPFDRKRAETAGANGHLTKPFESQALVARVEELIAATPSVAADEEGGRMDIISGGEVYRVDPGRAGESMRPAPTAGAAPQTAAPAAASGDLGASASAASSLPPFPAAAAAEDDTDRESRTHPALASPDPAAGGSFVGFADVGMDADMEGEIVPDRFDVGSRGESPASQGPRADGPSIGRRWAGPAAAAQATPESNFSGSFEAEFDLTDEESVPASTTGSRPEESAGGWMPPPEAPPAETWQGSDEREERPARDPVRAAAPVEPAPAVSAGLKGRGDAAADGPNVPLTPEMIDLIAEKVVQRLADRVVREVAWEVVPGVAEALVRKRIKELEESTS